jgi:hypothetical protein
MADASLLLISIPELKHLSRAAIPSLAMVHGYIAVPNMPILPVTNTKQFVIQSMFACTVSGAKYSTLSTCISLVNMIHLSSLPSVGGSIGIELT